MPNYDYFFAFFWGLAVLGVFIGYGRMLSHLCGWERKESLGWGMQAALGMAAVVAVGGWLLLCEVSTTPVIVRRLFIFSAMMQKAFPAYS